MDNFSSIRFFFIFIAFSFNTTSVQYPRIREDGEASDKPINNNAILYRMKQFPSINKLKKLALKVFLITHLPFIHVYILTLTLQ
uniref:Uncharacterized protein n=1 Tax=Lactuca sativa TaxID=4236 RepID=A0A9R1VK35_LACSA|nr:hypothetical protein LSAT_V11C500292860 [Lactuca sativa]